MDFRLHKQPILSLTKGLLVLLTLLVYSFGFSQNQNLPMSFNVSQKIESSIISNDENIHTAVKPFNQSTISTKTYENVFGDTGIYYYTLTQKLFKENLLFIEEKDVELVADPLFNFGGGRTFFDDSVASVFTNTRGVRVAGNITSKFSFETRYYENQFYYPQYLDSVADSRGVALGLGRSKVFKGIGHDVGMSSGYISYTPIKEVNVQFGQGKHFIGNGYRSMLLSDNATNYPYLGFSISLLKGKLFYKNINAWMQTLDRMPASSTAEALYKRKSASFRYLSFKPIKKLEVGIFEGIIYKRYEDTIGETPVDASFSIPIIGISSGMNSNKDENKVVLGVNFNYTPFSILNMYGQYVVDDFKRTGFQIGGKWLDAFRLKNSWLLMEYNHASSYLFSQSEENLIQNYAHANQELAHPLGASFKEFILMYHYERERWFSTLKFFTGTKERFAGSLFGESIFLPNNLLLPFVGPEKVNWSYYGGEVGYNLNVKTRMQIYSSIYSRSENGNNWKNNEWFWQIGFRTSLNNFYFEQ